MCAIGDLESADEVHGFGIVDRVIIGSGFADRLVGAVSIAAESAAGGGPNPSATLFALLNAALATVIGRCTIPQRHQEYLILLRLIDKEVQSALDIHLVVDNYATLRHDKVRGWLARRPRFHVRFTPTHSSWIKRKSSAGSG